MFTMYVLTRLFLSWIHILKEYQSLGLFLSWIQILEEYRSQMLIQSTILLCAFTRLTTVSIGHSMQGEYDVHPHSLSTKEEISTSPSLSLKYSSFMLGGDFVNISATYLSIEMYYSFMTPSRTFFECSDTWY